MSRLTIDYETLTQARNMVRNWGTDPDAVDMALLMAMIPGVDATGLKTWKKNHRRAVEIVKQADTVPTTDEQRVYSLADLADLAEPTPIISPLLMADTLAWLIGAPGEGKSLAALGMALSICTGHDWCGHAVQAGSVVYLAAEGASGLRKRANAYLRHKGFTQQLHNFHVLTESVDIADTGEVADLLAQFEDITEPIRLIVIDTQYLFYRGSENDAGTAGAYIRGLQALRCATGACILSLHHTNRASGQYRGSSVFLGAADTMLTIEKVKSREGCALVKCAKSKDNEPFPDVSLQFERVDLDGGATSAVLTLAGETVKQDAAVVQARKALTILEELGPSGASSAEWEAACGLAGITGGTYDRLVTLLMNDGSVIKEASRKGRYTVAEPL